MTEAALGVCLSSSVLLNLTRFVGTNITIIPKSKIVHATLLCSILIICLSWIMLDFTNFGSYNAPIHKHLTKYYINNTRHDISIPSMVAAIMSNYRSFDTFGETLVILISGLSVLIVMSRNK